MEQKPMQIGAKARFSTFRKNLNFYKENFGFINLIIIFASEGCTSPIYNIYIGICVDTSLK